MNNLQITPIHCAAINPNSEILKALLDAKPEYSIMDYEMRKPIHYAASSQTTDTLKYLISKGVDIREGDRKKMTPLMIASKHGRLHNVKLLLELVQEEQERTTLLKVKSREGQRAIHYAALNGHLEIVKILFEAGADLSNNGHYRLSPLH